MDRIQQEILEPALAALRQREIDYRGILYAGLMITPEGDPKVIEFNCRFGDPETQVVLPLLETPLDAVLLACAQQRLDQLPPLAWEVGGGGVCRDRAAQGYPESYQKGLAISGLERAEQLGATVFHAGTRLKQQLVTDGGRVLGVTSTGENLSVALAQVYRAIDCIQFEGMYYRRDIGHRALLQLQE